MIIIGEKINGVIPEVRKAIVERDADVILRYVSAQAQCGADYLDCAPSASSQTEYDVMLWLLELIQSSTELPVCLDSPNIKTLTRLLESGVKTDDGTEYRNGNSGYNNGVDSRAEPDNK